MFFSQCKKVSENGAENRILELVNMQQLKKCECFENKMLMEEFIEAVIAHKEAPFAVYFIKFLIENPLIVPVNYFVELIQHNLNRDLMVKRNIPMPNIPEAIFKLQLRQIIFLNLSKQIGLQDNFKIRHQNLRR